MFRGSIVAIVTPFKNGLVDIPKFKELIEFQIKNGTQGIVPCGTTGESPTLTHEEHNCVVETCVATVKKRVPVIAGTGSNSTAEAVALTRHAAKAGADGALVVTPYYNKPTQRGLYLHFKAVADSVKIPIILYNIEGRTARNIETDTVARLARDCKNIIGVKEASGNLQQIKDVRRACGEKFLIFSGDDALTLPVLEIGGVGVISVVANVIPKDVAALITAFNTGNKAKASEINDKMIPLIKAMFIETNPIPVKKAMELLGMCSSQMRLPLCDMEDANVEKLKVALHNYGLLKGQLV
ncbi:MAG: 4-hydroxy-tetrahydrodipicolinate synthase [Omnitrophica WOR_2 bacterium RIFCSPHIGHO2_01_FULL_52_10]|nr:MAG: 4-hydroxy-tetrahydrodipicolinate synthase [Omnitrophica WOR_2 bacterium RIFCSPHIGHO2_01_FULL_52_10]